MKNRENKDNSKEEGRASSDTPFENKPLPGEYPANEDIMNRRDEMERVSLDPDAISRTPGARTAGRSDNETPEPLNEFPPAQNAKANPTSKSDLTKEDYEALGPRDLSLDGGDDEQLKHRVWPVDFAARDLDVPAGDEERIDALGQGDEENNHYSLGGDAKDNLEDDPTPTLG
jgi:AAA ATPase containing von Willebrand factor type A (vWA) domain